MPPEEPVLTPVVRTDSPPPNRLPYILIPIVSVLIIAMLLVICVMLMKKRNKINSKLKPIPDDSSLAIDQESSVSVFAPFKEPSTATPGATPGKLRSRVLLKHKASLLTANDSGDNEGNDSMRRLNEFRMSQVSIESDKKTPGD